MEISVEFLSGLLGKPAGEISDALKKDDDTFVDQSQVEAYIKSAISDKLSAVRSESHDEGYSRAKKEVLKTEEKRLAEKFNVDSYSNLEELVESAIKANSQMDDLDPEKIRGSDVYQNDLKKLQEKLKETQQTYDEFKGQVQQKETMRTIKEKAVSVLEEGNFNLPEDSERKKFLLDVFLENLAKGRQFKVSDDGLTVLDADGNPVRDELQNPVDFKTLTEQQATLLFDKKDGDDRKSPGAGTQTPRGGNKVKFTDEADYLRKAKAAKSLEELQSLKDAYQQQVANS